MWKRRHVKYPLFLTDCNETWIFSKYCRENSNIKFHQNPFSGRRMDTTQLIVAFCKFANPPKNWSSTCARHKGEWGSGCIAPFIPILGFSWRWMASFTPRPLYLRCPADRRLGGTKSRPDLLDEGWRTVRQRAKANTAVQADCSNSRSAKMVQ